MTSGPVSFPRIPAIILERVAASTMSTISFPLASSARPGMRATHGGFRIDEPQLQDCRPVRGPWRPGRGVFLPAQCGRQTDQIGSALCRDMGCTYVKLPVFAVS